MDVTPEKLKKYAEVMGHTNVLKAEAGWVTYIFHPSENLAPIRFHYDPLNDADQREEMQLWLEGKGWEFCKKKVARHWGKMIILDEATTHYERLCMAMDKQLGIGDL